MDYKLSQDIYKSLIRGKYINKHTYDKTTNTNNNDKLYFEIDTNISEYTDLYKKLGFTLNDQNDFFYLSKKYDLNDETHIEQSQYKEYILMLIILRNIVNKKIDINNLIDYKIGIPKSVFEEMLINEEFINILTLSEINSVSNPIKNVLIDRNILFLNQKENYVVTNIGNTFIEYIKNTGKDLVGDDEDV